MNIVESNWTEVFKERAVDFFLEQHSPQTTRILNKMESSQYMKDILELDGPARRTRAAIKRALDLRPIMMRLDHLLQDVGMRSIFLAIVTKGLLYALRIVILISKG